jgi:preprotein translocase SecE subunit
MADKTLSGANGDRERPEDEEREPARVVPVQEARERREPGVSPFRVIKPGQGIRVRWGTAIFAGALVLAGVSFAYEWLRVPFGDNLWARTLIPVGLLAAVAYLVFHLVAQRRGTVDFMIATEGEMKKVNWSSRKEVLGATRVVIFTMLAIGVLLAAADFLFIMFFGAIKVLKAVDVTRMIGAGEGP